MIYLRTESGPCFNKGTIIDFETIGVFDKRYQDHRQYREVYPVIFGTLNDQGIRIQYIIDHEDIDEMLYTIETELKTLKQPFWAFNKMFEESIIYLHCGKTYEFWELNSWRYESKREAEKELNIPQFDDPFEGHGELVIEEWPGNHADCVLHNRACLLKEQEIWKGRYDVQFTFLGAP